ncbi:MAG: lamin tail domain-containing protein [Bacteroidales bacterium]|nr:lamin tail domain-containing protein [Bacteroidales bacterium]
MKKFTLSLTLMLFAMFCFTSFVSAQNLALNSGFENWNTNGAGGPPDDWTLSGSSMTGAQESTIVRTGSYSTNLTWTTTSTRYLQQFIAVTAGNNYEFSFWVLDNDAGGRARVAIRWYDAGGSFISGFYGDYSTDDANWQQLTSGSQTADAGAVEAHVEVRVYDISGWPGTATVYVDDANFSAVTTVEISKAYAINATSLDVIYSADVTTVNAGDYSLTGTSAITFSGATIDGADAKIVHLTGASANMTGDNTVDNIDDAANTTDYDFYAGIMPISNTNTTNPSGIIDGTHIASFIGIVSANDAYNNVWMSDAAGERDGVLIYDYDFDGLVDVGDEIHIIAIRDVYNSLTELVSPELISVISTGNSPYGPTTIDGSDIDETIAADTDPGEKWEGQLVKIENFTVDSYANYCYVCSWSDATTTYHFHIGDNVDYHLNNVTLNVGETYAGITGVIDWDNPNYYRINPREQSDVVAGAAAARIVGSMQGWNTTDPDYVMNVNANGLYELTKSLDAGDHEYKVLEGDDWSAPNYPGNNQHVILSATENVTWKANITDELVTHTLPVVAGDFLTAIGGNNWDPSELLGEMTDPDGDDIFTLELTIPAGNYECKVTFNHNWDQSTGGNTPFITDGVNSTTFTYDFPNNITTVSGPPPPSATITFIVNDAAGQNYDGFFLKGSWDANGFYDPSWGGGIEHSPFYDDGTNGDVTADDHIWTCQQELIVDGGSNNWEWGVNDTDHNWVAGNWQFTIPDDLPQELSWTVPTEPAIIVNEIMYNSPGYDEEWIELYNNSGAAVSLENWKIKDNSASNPPIIIPAGYSIDSAGYFTISIATDGNFPFTPDFDGTGFFALNNGGDDVRVYNPDGILLDIVSYDDSSPWPTTPDGNGPTLALIDPSFDNSLPDSWLASAQDGGTPGAVNFPTEITVLTPEVGDQWEQGTANDITWSIANCYGDVRIELTLNASSGTPVWTELVASVPAQQESWTWNIPFSQPVSADCKIRIADNGSSIFDDSGIFSIIETVIIPDIVITEIMYNPPESGDDTIEFIELYNNDASAVNLENYYFSDGVEFTFPSCEILPGEYVLVSINSVAMLNTFGIDAYQWTNGGLANGGELIQLVNGIGTFVDSVNYDNNVPWPTICDGSGPSLTLCDPDSDNALVENWSASINFAAVNANGDTIFATPGSACVLEPIAEFIADTTIVLIGETVNFTDLSEGSIDTWAWIFDGGTPATSNLQNPPGIVYDAAGTYTVTLTVENEAGTSTNTKTDYISVGVALVADFEADNVNILEGESVNFTDLSSGDPETWEWTFEGGTPDTSTAQNPASIQYNLMGSYDVTLNISNMFGVNSITKTDYINVEPIGIPEGDARQFNIYPNPNNGKFYIEFKANSENEIRIFSVVGELIYYKTVNEMVLEINLSQLNKGVYLVNVYNEDSKSFTTKKLIIQ